jgi:hypothetical protein|tara:strand:+ start:214 stop:501 length:288 start_codon:yes stop_codon:yes gene_type:complete
LQVSANNLLEQEGSWRFSFRDHSALGHDKAEALRRAQRDARPAHPDAMLVGRFACDLAAVQVAPYYGYTYYGRLALRPGGRAGRGPCRHDMCSTC